MKNVTRRDFLRSSALIAVGVATPPWLAKIAKADLLRQAKGGKVDPDNILVVCQLTGGNDGLNTVVPWADSRYRQLRPSIGIAENEVLKLNESIGLHPQMTGLKQVFDTGKAAIIQNVGYPNPDRSHFKSMEIWQSASPDGHEAYGWLGRYLDHQATKGSPNPVMAISLTRARPQALSADEVAVPCFASLADIKTFVGDPDSERMLREVQGMMGEPGADAEVVRKANLSALDAMSELNKALGKYQSKTVYAKDQFGQGFSQIAQLIATSPRTRVIYFSAGGFDTHSNQPDQHANLLKGFSDALKAFQDEMIAIGKGNKVTVMVFSEFGRRCQENASKGTDHGSGAPMFVVGGGVKGGIVGPNPDLVNLDRGDVPWKVDFRQVYSSVLDSWMGSDSEAIFKKKFAHVPIF